MWVRIQLQRVNSTCETVTGVNSTRIIDVQRLHQLREQTVQFFPLAEKRTALQTNAAGIRCHRRTSWQLYNTANNNSAMAGWRHQEFSFRGYSQGSGGTKFPSGVQGRSPGRVSEGGGRNSLQILTAETIKIWKFHTIHFLILYNYLSRWRLSDIWGTAG